MQISVDLSTLQREAAIQTLRSIAAYFSFELSIATSPTDIVAQQTRIDDACAAPTEPAVAQIPLPQPAPFTAAVQPLPTAPMDPQASFQTQTPAASLPVPPIVPPAIVPTAPAIPTMPVGGVELDNEGMPWDARIHASTKTKTQAGVWKAKKGASAPAVEAVRAELKALMSVQAPAMPAMPTPGAPAAADNAAPVTLSHFMTIVTNAMLNGTLPQSSMLETIQTMGLPSIPSLSQRPDMIPAVYARLVAKYPAMAQ